MQLIVNESKCTGCGACAGICPVGAITVAHVAQITQDTCIRCGACIGECPFQALSFESPQMTTPSALAPAVYPGTPQGHSREPENHSHRSRGVGRFWPWSK